MGGHCPPGLQVKILFPEHFEFPGVHCCLQTSHAIRFCKIDEFLPNMEVKFPKAIDEHWVLQNPRKVIMNSKELFLSSLEVQIAFKLSLGSEKDIEDARYIYKLFNNHLDHKLLEHNINKLNVQIQAKRYL